jgi:hypothetical protein
MPDSLTSSQSQVNRTLGVSLAQLYQPLIEAPLPDRLKALVDQLDAALAGQGPRSDETR